jgi:ferredoxin
LYCRELCPAHALSGDDGEAYAGLDEASCQQHEQRLQAAYCDPCGLCLKSCPVGEDRQLFQSADFDKYFAEQNVLAQDPAAKQYRDWVHLRSYGSYPLKET